ncbi:MAG: carbamoyl phosphate synthase small subunit [Eubacteriales bacterium]|jgi:carbamoyl-phosphate synthase small subunit
MSLYKNYKKAWLVLEDGSVFEGKSFGCEGTTVGEVVFATGMTGYQETLTDPSYFGQIVTQTFPMIGNYGVNSQDFESDKVYLKGYIVREYCEEPNNFRCEGTIDEFLKKQGVIALYDIDTRALTRRIREKGVMNGAITTEEARLHDPALLAEIHSYVIRDAVKSVSIKEYKVYEPEEERYHVVLMDFGYKRNIRKKLLARGMKVTVVPYNTSLEEIMKLNPDGIMLSNGPGDPEENVEVINTLRQIIGTGIPVFGICLGHQLMALAHGARTEKMKYGHRGANQPVIDLKTGRTYVTTQNHGYAVVSDSITPEMGQVSHVNANDKSCEGVRYTDCNAFTVQFHPEAFAGPLDTGFLFDNFMKMMDEKKEGK